MKAGTKKVILLSGMVSMLTLLAAGCGLASENGVEADRAADALLGEAEEFRFEEGQNTAEAGQADEQYNASEAGQAEEPDNAAQAGPAEEQNEAAEAGQTEGQDKADAGESQGASTRRRHVLDPDTAAAVDADFEGDVWKIDTDCFYIVEETTELLEDGSMSSSSPAAGVEIPDSELIRVVFSEDTHFYTRTIYDNGARYEDAEAGFKDLEQYGSVALKGEFKNEVFCADEVRIVKIP